MYSHLHEIPLRDSCTPTSPDQSSYSKYPMCTSREFVAAESSAVSHAVEDEDNDVWTTVTHTPVFSSDGHSLTPPENTCRTDCTE